MKSNKDIQNHLDQLINNAENPSKLTTSAGFEDRLSARFDAIDSGKAQKRASLFTLSELRKYAAVILILILNISAILFYSNSPDSEQSTEDITQYSDDYFPDYATLTSLE